MQLPPKRMRKPIWMSRSADVPEFATLLANKEEFKKVFFKIAREYQTNLEAYEFLEELRMRYFGVKMFLDYEEFRNAMIE